MSCTLSKHAVNVSSSQKSNRIAAVRIDIDRAQPIVSKRLLFNEIRAFEQTPSNSLL